MKLVQFLSGFIIMTVCGVFLVLIDCKKVIKYSEDCDKNPLAYPKINISYFLPSGPEGEPAAYMHNLSSHLELPSPPTKISFTCSAGYPVEWAFNKIPDVYQWLTNFARVRNIDNPKNASLYRYFTKLIIERANAKTLERGATCRSVSDRCLQTSINSKNDDNGKYSLNFIHEPNIEITSEGKRFFPDDECALILKVDKKTQTFYCKSKKEGEYPTIINPKNCQDVIKCNSESVDRNCPNDENETIDMNNCKLPECKKYQLKVNFLPANVICQLGETQKAVSLGYFYSIHHNKNELKRYFNWDEVDPNEMIVITQLSNRVLWTGQIFEISCNGSYYYFASGFYFEIKMKDQQQQNDKPVDISHFSISNIDRSQTPIKNYESLNINRSLVLTNAQFYSPGEYTITCFAPVWNSTKYIESKSDFTILESTSPVILGPKNVTINASQLNGTKCEAFGIPEPEVEWYDSDSRKLSPLKFRKEIERHNNITTVKIIFLKKEYYGDLLVCKATNFLGTVEKFIHINNYENQIFILISGCIAAFVILSAIFIIFLLSWKVKKQGKQLRLLTQDEINEFLFGRPDYAPLQSDTNTYAYYLPYNDSYEIPIDHLHIDIDKCLGKGAYGRVYMGSLSYKSKLNSGGADKLKVAIKTIDPKEDNITSLKALLSELKIMAFIGEHKNVVNLLGACTKNIIKREVFIAIEYCENGNLLNFLQNHRDSFVASSESNSPAIFQNGNNYIPLEDLAKFSTQQKGNGYENSMRVGHLFRWATEICDGMIFLCGKNVIHGDLATRNVLLDSSFGAKICDFGLSKRLNSNYANSNYIGNQDTPLPWRWLALESLQVFQFSIHSDIWSFAVTLWEIFTLGDVPYANLFNYPSDEFVSFIKNGQRLKKPNLANDRLYSLMLDCWSVDKIDRPSFSDINERLKQIF